MLRPPPPGAKAPQPTAWDWSLRGECADRRGQSKDQSAHSGLHGLEGGKPPPRPHQKIFPQGNKMKFIKGAQTWQFGNGGGSPSRFRGRGGVAEGYFNGRRGPGACATHSVHSSPGEANARALARGPEDPNPIPGLPSLRPGACDCRTACPAKRAARAVPHRSKPTGAVVPSCVRRRIVAATHCKRIRCAVACTPKPVPSPGLLLKWGGGGDPAPPPPPEAGTTEPSDVRRHPEPGPPTPAVPFVGVSRGLKPVPPTESWTTGG